MTNVSLQKSFQPKEGKEVAVVVTGEVILHNEEDYGQPLVATTRLLTATGIMFRLKDRVVVPAKGTVTAAVYADQPGKESEIGPSQFTIPGLSVDKQKVIYATSDKAMVGGVTRVGILGQSDWQEATQELQADLEKAGKEKLSVLHPDLTVAYKLVDLNVTSKQKVGEETSGFTLAGTAKLVGVFYNNEEVKTLATKELNKRLVSDNEVLAVDEGGVAVVISDYNTASSTAAAELSASGRVSLNSESRQLDKSLFYGKNKDEVRRYLLSLDHVQGVEIKFTPAWMRTVPAIADHVSVIVKLTE
jgi:hypothetical protein